MQRIRADRCTGRTARLRPGAQPGAQYSLPAPHAPTRTRVLLLGDCTRARTMPRSCAITHAHANVVFRRPSSRVITCTRLG